MQFSKANLLSMYVLWEQELQDYKLQTGTNLHNDLRGFTAHVVNDSTCVIVPFVTFLGNGLFFTFAEFLSSVGVILALGTGHHIIYRLKVLGVYRVLFDMI